MAKFLEDKKKQPPAKAAEMPFLEHLEELRMTILKCVVAILISCFLVGIFVFQINDILMYPFNKAVADLGRPIESPRVSTLFAPLFVMFQIVVFAGFFIALPFILYFIMQFLLPALTKRERGIIVPGFFSVIILFLMGVAMAYFFILPFAMKFSLELAQEFEWGILYDLESYFTTVILICLGMGISFELPLLVVILIYVGILKPAFLRKHRRVIFVVILIFSAIVTPPDPITLLLMAFPLYILYELAVIVGDRMLKRKLAGRRDGYEEDEDFRKTKEDDSRYNEREFKRIEEPREGPADEAYLSYEEEQKKHYPPTDYNYPNAEPEGESPSGENDTAAGTEIPSEIQKNKEGGGGSEEKK